MHVAIGTDARHVLSQCSGGYLMMAGRRTGDDSFLLLAQAAYADVTFNSGRNATSVHNANGSDWYFSHNWSWGFTEAGDDVWQSACDVTAGAKSMCLHTLDYTGGYRIGDLLALNSNPDYEKVFFVSNGEARRTSLSLQAWPCLASACSGSAPPASGRARRRAAESRPAPQPD